MKPPADDARQKLVLRAGTQSAAFFQSNGVCDVIQGPLGSGKTRTMMARIMRHIQQQRVSRITGRRMSRWGVVRNTYPLLKDTTVKTWKDVAPEEVYGKMNMSSPMRHLLRWGDIDAEIIFLALDEAADYAKLRSFEFTAIAWNELPFIRKDLFDEASSRLRWPGPEHGGSEWHGMIADANAPDEDHWLAMMTGQSPVPPNLTARERAEYEWPKEWGFFRQPPAVLEVKDQHGAVVDYKVNPAAENLENLREDYYSEMLSAKKKPWIDSRLRNVVATYIEGSPVWPQFNAEVHVSREPLRPMKGYVVDVGLDFGLMPAAIFMQGMANRVFVQHELLGFNEGSVTFAPKVKRFLAEHYPGYEFRIHGDPKGRDRPQSDMRTSYEVFAENGLRVDPPPGLKQNMIATRVDAVTKVLTEMYDGRPRFVLSPLCRTLKLAMAGRYHLVREEDGELRPKKDMYSNPADALQYGILGLGEGRAMIGLKPIGELRGVQTWKRKQGRGKTMRRLEA